MQDFYLKFNNEAEANAVLYTTQPELLKEGGEVIQEALTQPNYRNIDVLGIIYNISDPENPVEIPGWHVNVRLVESEDSVALEPFAIVPTNPRRIWS